MPYDWEPAYRDERNKLIDGEQDNEKSYDKYVLMLSGGALALSLTFVQDIIDGGPVREKWLIVTAWFSFTFSIGATLVSIHQSGPLFRDFLAILDRKAQHAGDKFSWTEVRTDQEKLRRLKLIDWLNYSSLVLFLLGVIMLLCFSGCNLKGVTIMSDKTQPAPKVVVGGRKPAMAPVDVNPNTVSPVPDGRAGKPPLAPVDVAPPSQPPAEPAPPPPATSEPTPSQPSGGQD